MTWFEVLVEGAADVPVLREVLQRRFGLVEEQDFRIHPHRGKGALPADPDAPLPKDRRGLLDQLPAKLRAFSYGGPRVCVLVLVDADDTPCHWLLTQLNSMLDRLSRRPERVLFRIAIEETESWFLADDLAIRAAYPRARTRGLRLIKPDSIIGAWEKLADTLGERRSSVSGSSKLAWATAIAPHLDLSTPRSPSLLKLIEGIDRELKKPVAR